MEEIIKYLEEIKEHQMQTVQLARSTEVYKLADKALTKALTIHSVVVPKGTLCDEMCCENKATHIAYTEHRYNCEKHR